MVGLLTRDPEDTPWPQPHPPMSQHPCAVGSASNESASVHCVAQLLSVHGRASVTGPAAPNWWLRLFESLLPASAGARSSHVTQFWPKRHQ